MKPREFSRFICSCSIVFLSCCSSCSLTQAEEYGPMPSVSTFFRDAALVRFAAWFWTATLESHLPVGKPPSSTLFPRPGAYGSVDEIDRDLARQSASGPTEVL